MTDYETLYNQKCEEFDELNEQFLAYQGNHCVKLRIVRTHDLRNRKLE